MGGFCCICGKEGFFDRNICPECAAKDGELTKESLTSAGKEQKPVRYCRFCRRVFLKKRWTAPKQKYPRIIKVKCPDCYKEGVEHYTTILQFQNIGDRKKEVEGAIKNALLEEEERGKRTAVTKVDEEMGHYYFTHQSTARLVARKLEKSHPIQVRTDSSLIGFDHAAGKGKFKVSFLIRFLD